MDAIAYCMYITTNGTRLFEPFKIIEIDDMKVLFIGIITDEIIAQAKVDGLVGSFIDTAEAAEERMKAGYDTTDWYFSKKSL